MNTLFDRILDLYSKEIAGKDIQADCAKIKSEIWSLPGDDIKAMLAKGIRENFLPEDSDSTFYGFDDMIDFLQWLHDRFDLPTVPLDKR